MLGEGIQARERTTAASAKKQIKEPPFTGSTLFARGSPVRNVNKPTPPILVLWWLTPKPESKPCRRLDAILCVHVEGTLAGSVTAKLDVPSVVASTMSASVSDKPVALHFREEQLLYEPLRSQHQPDRNRSTLNTCLITGTMPVHITMGWLRSCCVSPDSPSTCTQPHRRRDKSE